MSSQLKKTESPGDALRRVCHGHADQALALLKNGIQPGAIHGVRKEIKRLRAIFRLTRGGLGRDDYRKVAESMRLAAKPLSTSRDAQVTKKAFETLVGRKARQFADIRSALETWYRHAESSFKNQDSKAVARFILRKTGGQLDDLKIERAGWTEIKARLKKCYARGHDACRLAFLKPTPEYFHEWRKLVKNLWYQLDFLCPDWPPRTREMFKGLDKLGELLGEDHDLVLLEHFVEAQGEHGDETTELRRLIDSRRKRLVAGIRHLGSRLYAKTPEAVCAQVERDWKKWRRGR